MLSRSSKQEQHWRVSVRYAALNATASDIEDQRAILHELQHLEAGDLLGYSIEEILAQPTMACTTSLPVADMGESMLNDHPLT